MVDEYEKSNALGFDWVEATSGERLVLEMGEIRYPSNDVSLLAGEVALALRGTLDGAVWEIIRDNYPGDFSRVAQQVCFPIFNSEPAWTRKANYRLPKAPPVLVARIRRCQPFVQTSGYPVSMLALLRDTNDKDKHRRSVGLNAKVDDGIALNAVHSPDPEVKSAVTAWLKSGMTMAQADPESGLVVFDSVVPEFVESVRARGEPDIELRIEVEGGKHLPIREIGRMIDYVEQVLWYVQAGAPEQSNYLDNATLFEPRALDLNMRHNS